MVGITAILVAILVPWGYGHWLKTRTFEPVGKAVTLEAGRVYTEDFEINLREIYHVQIDVDYTPDYYIEERTCPFRYWEAADWKVYRLGGHGEVTRELWASSVEMREQGEIPIGFKGSSGKYQLEWSVRNSSVCLNKRHPSLHVYTASAEYEEFGALLVYACVFVAGTGILLVLRATAGWVFGYSIDKRPPRIFPEMELRNVIPWRRRDGMPLIKEAPNFGLIYGGILWILVFIFMIVMPPTPIGLRVDFREQKAVGVEKSPWTETVTVYIDAQRGYLVNGHAVSREELKEELKKVLSRQMVWMVYLEADPDCLFMDVAYAMDTIQGLGAKLVWITPKTRKEWKKSSR